MQRRNRLVSVLALASCSLAIPTRVHAQDPASGAVPTEEVSPSPPPPEPEVPTPPPQAAPQAESSCAAQAHARASAAAVRVESGGRWGAGALIADASHVVTLLRIVEQGHGITIVDAQGNRRAARIVLTADSDELAMLELDAPLPGAPLPLAPWDAVTVGTPVVVIGAPVEGSVPRGLPSSARGTLPWAASEGIVSARGERAIQTDARSRTPRGSPIVSCAGELIALLGNPHGRMMGPAYRSMPAVPALTDLVSRVDRPEGYGGRWNLTGGIAIAGTYEDPDWLWGGMLTIGVIGFDAFILASRMSYFFSTFEPTGSDIASVHKDRFRGDAYVGWRQILTFGRMSMYFELAAGASVTYVRREARSAEIVDDPAGPALRWRESETTDWSVRPMGVINLLHGPMMLSYTIEYDVDREHVVHVFAAGGRL